MATDFSKPARPRRKNDQWMNGVLARRAEEPTCPRATERPGRCEHGLKAPCPVCDSFIFGSVKDRGLEPEDDT